MKRYRLISLTVVEMAEAARVPGVHVLTSPFSQMLLTTLEKPVGTPARLHLQFQHTLSFRLAPAAMLTAQEARLAADMALLLMDSTS